MPISFTVADEYGYVVLVGVSSAVVMTYLGSRVIGAREKCKVALPSLYADQAEALKDKDKHLFNCYQRGHQNALESYAQNLMLLFVGGLKHPLISSGAGLVWILGRILYAQGYSSGDPSKRSRGSIQYLGVLTMLGCTISTAASMLRWV